MKAALCAKFAILFQVLFAKVSHFVIVCNLVNLLDVAPAASNITIQIRAFPQMKRTIAKAVLEKLLTPPAVSSFIRGKWKPWDLSGLSAHQEYA